MKMKLPLRLVLALLFCSSYTALVAQTDTSWLDLGRIKLKKEFTQTVTIKGKDLEQMPFSNLADAINVWLYGLATNKGSVVYVIDGNMITDVNVYSVHDIEEITLVQNALIQLNGSTREKQLILITTRKNSGKSAGINVAGSSFAVTNSFQNSWGDKVKGETHFYHQYYLSVYKNHSKIQYGLSANYLRDVYPYSKGFNLKQPYHVNRFRFNGYMNAVIDANNSAWLRAGYIPTNLGIEYDVNSIPVNSKNKTNYFTVEAGWQSRLFKRLTNEFSAGFTPITGRGHTTSITSFPGPTGSILRENLSTNKTTFNNFLLSDQFVYHGGFGNWHIEPAVNFTYRSVKAIYTTHTTIKELPSSIVSLSETRTENKYNVFLLTPAVNVDYKNSFNVQGGFVYNMSKTQQYSSKAEKLLPFVTMTVNVLNAIRPDSKIDWKVFGSYAHAGNFADGVYQLPEVTSAVQYANPFPSPVSSNYMPLLYGGDSSNYMMQTGTSVHLWNGRLQAGYSFEKRKHRDYIGSSPGFPVPVIFYADIYNTIHRLGITAKVMEGTQVNWLTALNASIIKRKVKVDIEVGGPIVTGNSNKNKPLWTGGWVNRLNYKKWIAGLDILYVFNHKDYSGYTWGKDNSFSFRNIYAGYQLLLRQTPLDVFAECRNPGQKNENNIPDRRTYYGLGFKAGL